MNSTRTKALIIATLQALPSPPPQFQIITGTLLEQMTAIHPSANEKV